MKTQKTYIATGNRARLNIEIKVKGKFRRIDFSNGGLSTNGNARFQTSDADIQKALESSPMFGDMYKLQSQKQLQEPVKAAGQEPAAKKAEQAQANGADNAEQGAGEPISFPNFNSLRDYLVSEHGCKPADVKTLDIALATAKGLGLEVTIE